MARRHRRLRARRSASRHVRRWCGQWCVFAYRMPEGRARGGSGGGRRSRSWRERRRSALLGRRGRLLAQAALACRRQEKGLRRFPERRDGVRHRARRPGRLPVGRASEALHHAWHGDRPGQELERAGPRHHGRADRPLDPGDRHHHLPPALCAGGDRRAGRPSSRREFPQRAPDAVASLGGRARRDLRRHRAVEARAVVSAARREGLAGIGHPRGEGGREAASASAMSRRSARSTCTGTDAGAFLDRVYINTFSTLRGRQGALRADAARGRHRL